MATNFVQVPTEILAVAHLVSITPSNLVATADGENAIDLTWDDNSSDELSFKIERALDALGPFSLIHTTAANAESYSDTGLTEGTAYYYRVYAVNSYGNSAYTDVATDTTDSSDIPLTNLIGWYKANTGLFSDTGMTTPQAVDGGNVKGWEDQSSEENHITTSGTAPVLSTNELNGEDVVTFARTPLAFDAPMTTSSFHVFIVSKNTEAGDVAGSMWLGSTSVDSTYIYSGKFPGGDCARIQADGGGAQLLGTYLNTWTIIDTSYDASDSKIALNGGAFTTGPSTGTSLDFDGVGAYVAAYPEFQASGDLAEMIIYSAPLSGGDRTEVLTYLNDKYAIY